MDDAQLQDSIVACERKVWNALVAGDASSDATALADDFLGIYPDGPADKAAHVGQLDRGPTVAGYVLRDFQHRALAPGVSLLSYRADFNRVGKTQPEVMYVTSIWEMRAGDWVNIFSQDTPT